MHTDSVNCRIVGFSEVEYGTAITEREKASSWLKNKRLIHVGILTLTILRPTEGYPSDLKEMNVSILPIQTESEDKKMSMFRLKLYNQKGILLFSLEPETETSTINHYFRILNEKYIDQKVILNNEKLRSEAGIKQKRKKRKIAFGLIQPTRNYKDILVTKQALTFNQNSKVWQIHVSFSVIANQDKRNKFTADVNALLQDISTSLIPASNELYLPKMTSNYVQSHFNQYIISCTNERLKNLRANRQYTAVDSVINGKLFPFQKDSLLWLLEKEHYFDCNVSKTTTSDQKHEDSVSELLYFLNHSVSFGYSTIKDLVSKQFYFWNKYTGYILSQEEVRSLKSSFNEYEVGAKGVLAEEMGLGKTLEILALICINKRKYKADEPLDFVSESGKVISKCSTTLIVCPGSILKQWIDEMQSTHPAIKIYHYGGFIAVKKEFACDNINTIVQKLSQYDIVITSYNVVSNEVHYAQFNNAFRQNRRRHVQYDYSSPLSLMQFYRIILDELQMLHSGSTKAAICTSLLHRVHTWGVSGTPIQKVRDFQTILSYLKIHPFSEFPELIKNLDNASVGLTEMYSSENGCPINEIEVIKNGINTSLSDLFYIFKQYDIAIRHSKANVSSQIKIPKQHLLLIPLKFTPIEWESYLEVWKSFLEDSGFNPDGTNSTHLTNQQLNQWLHKLRYICCHAVLPHSASINNITTANEIHTLNDILKKMKAEAEDKVESLYREQFQLLIRSAQFDIEEQGRYNFAIDCLLSLEKNIFDRLKPLTKSSNDILNFLEYLDIADSHASSKSCRHLLELLHQCYFFIATAYYYLGSYQIECKQDAGIPIRQDDLCNDETLKNHFSPDEIKSIAYHKNLEDEYYSRAENIRRSILKGRIAKFEQELDEVQKSHFPTKAIMLIKFEELPNCSISLSTNKCYSKLLDLFSKLDEQAIQSNRQINLLYDLLSMPIIKEYDSDTPEKTHEYASSIEDQDKIYALFDCLEKLISNREEIVRAEEEVTPPKISLSLYENLSTYHTELLKDQILISGTPFKTIFDDLENVRIVHRISKKQSNDKSFEASLLSYKKCLKKIRKENAQLRSYLQALNTVYNAKVDYYAYLQRISDSVVPLSQLDSTTLSSLRKFISNVNKKQELQRKIVSTESRVKYLHNLSTLTYEAQKNTTMECSICLQPITNGAMVNCGHLFCTSCIFSWLKNRKTCPLCKHPTSNCEVYNFTFKLESGSSRKTKCDNKTRHHRYPNMQNFENTLDSLFLTKYERFKQSKTTADIIIKESYGSKIDFIIKLVLFLLHQSEIEDATRPQILMYSQSFDFMKVVSQVLSLHNINNICCLQNNRNVGDMIARFKKTSDITCLLLNIRSLGAGLNLLNARHIFLLDPILNVNEEIQAMSRNNRIGQRQETYVWNFMLENTVEESIMRYKCVLENQNRHKREERSMPMYEQSEQLDVTDSEVCISDFSNEVVSEQHIRNCLFLK